MCHKEVIDHEKNDEDDPFSSYYYYLLCINFQFVLFVNFAKDAVGSS